jgi:hypothetical protein
MVQAVKEVTCPNVSESKSGSKTNCVPGTHLSSIVTSVQDDGGEKLPEYKCVYDY